MRHVASDNAHRLSITYHGHVYDAHVCMEDDGKAASSRVIQHVHGEVAISTDRHDIRDSTCCDDMRYVTHATSHVTPTNDAGNACDGNADSVVGRRARGDERVAGAADGERIVWATPILITCTWTCA